MPPLRQQVEHLGAGEAVVDQPDRAAVLLGADHAPGRLHHLLDAGIQIGVVVAGAEHRLHALAQLFVDRVHLGQAEGRDEGADQPFARQVDAFAERAAQHREADPAPARGEAIQEGGAFQLAHPARLAPGRNVRVPCLEGVRRLLQVVEAAEEGQVVAGRLRILARHQFGDRLQ